MSRELRDPVNRPEKGEREEQGAVATFGMWQDRNSESYVRREGARAQRCAATVPECRRQGLLAKQDVRGAVNHSGGTSAGNELMCIACRVACVWRAA